MKPLVSILIQDWLPTFYPERLDIVKASGATRCDSRGSAAGPASVLEVRLDPEELWLAAGQTCADPNATVEVVRDPILG
jgi:hypothetical protein